MKYGKYETMQSSLGHVECCAGCHRFKRIQFVLISLKAGETSLCSAACMKDWVARTLFPEDEEWLNQEWVPEREEWVKGRVADNV